MNTNVDTGICLNREFEFADRNFGHILSAENPIFNSAIMLYNLIVTALYKSVSEEFVENYLHC